ncbi:MAG: dockerin type I domain-containing protein [Lachnospiraceae bacterium]|nr:dockerin type I domain-containing protein [Lachnospiraceae bacterium]
MKTKKALSLSAAAVITAVFCLAALTLLFFPRSSSAEVPLLQEGRMSVRHFLAEGDETGSSDPVPNEPEDYPEALTEALYAGLTAGESEIFLSDFAIDPDQLRGAMQELINSRPELFFVSGKYTYRHSLNVVVSIKPEYLFTGDELAEKQTEYETMLNTLLDRISPDASDLEKVLAVNDLLCLGFSYEEEPDVFDAYHFMKDRKGVCQSYTLTAAALFNRLGIESTYAQSETMNHIWNLVLLDGEWYHLDITWNDPTPDAFGRASHKNLLLNDADITAAKHYDWTVSGGITVSDESYALPFRQVSYPVYPFGGCYYYQEGGEIVRQDAETGETSFPFPLHGIEGLASNGEFLFASSEGILYSIRIPEEEIIPLMTTPVPGGIYGMLGEVVYSDGSTAAVSPGLPSTEYAVLLYRDGIFLGTFTDVQSAFSAIEKDPRENAEFLLRVKLNGGLIPFREDTVLPEGRNLVFSDSILTVSGACETDVSFTLVNSVLYPQTADASLTVNGSLKIETPSASLSLPVTAAELSLLAPDGSAAVNGALTADILRTSGTVRLNAPVTVGLLNADADSVLEIGERAELVIGSVSCPDLTVIPFAAENRFLGFSLGKADVLGALTVRLNSLPPLEALVLPTDEETGKKNAVTFLLDDADLTPLFAYDGTEGGLVRRLDTWLEIEGTTLLRCVSVSDVCEAYVPEGVTAIADYAFADIPGLSVIYLPDTVTDLGYFPFGFTRDADGEMVRSERLTVFAQTGSVGAAFAAANGFPCREYFTASVSGYTGVFFLEESTVRLTGYSAADGSTVLVPTALTLGGENYTVVSLSDTLFGSAGGLNVFTLLDPSVVPAVWQENHSVYAGGRWHTLTVVLDGAVLSYPVPADESPAKYLPVQSRPDRDNIRYLFRGYDLDGDGEPDEIPDVLEEDTTAAVVFEEHDKPDSFNVLFLLPDGSLYYSETVKAGEPIGLPGDEETPAVPEWEEGAVFTGWCGYLPGMTAREDTIFIAGFLTEENDSVLTSPLLAIEDGYLLLPAPMTREELLCRLDQREGVVLGARGAATGETVRYRDVTLTVLLPGDLNGDGSVSVTDYLILRSELLGKRESEGITRAASDMNGDGNVTVTDLLRVGAIILGKTA